MNKGSDAGVEFVELYRIGFLDVMLTIVTSGLFILVIIWLNRVEVNTRALTKVEDTE